MGAKAYQRCIAGGHCSQCSNVYGSSLHSGHVRLEKTVCIGGLGGLHPPAFQEKCSYTMAVRGLLVEGSVTVSRMRTFAVANEMGRGVVSVSVAVSAAFANSSAASLPGIPL